MTDEAEIDELFADTEKHMGYDLLSYNLYLDELKEAIHTLLIKARMEELNSIQLEYGHYAAQTFINGQPQRITDRIAELQKELEGE